MSKKNYFKLKIIIPLLIIEGALIYPHFLLANNDLIINEIAWMGTENSANDEWLELKNNSEQEIDLTGWTLQAIDGSPQILLEGTIASQDYFLLERTNDDSVSGITADQIYAGALGNSGEKLELRDANNNLIDSVDCLNGWLAGDNQTKQTMEKTDNGWRNSSQAGGSPKALNNSQAAENLSTEDPIGDSLAETNSSENNSNNISNDSNNLSDSNQPPQAISQTNIAALVNQEIFFDASKSIDPDNDILNYFWNFGDGSTDIGEKVQHTYAYPGHYTATLTVSDKELSDSEVITIDIYSQSIIISEFVPNPQDSKSEWIEIYNGSDQVADLTSWQIDSRGDKKTPFFFPEKSLLAPKHFLVIENKVSKISLDDKEGELQLLYPNSSLASRVAYSGENKKGFSVAFNNSEYLWTKIPTPGSTNFISLNDFASEINYSVNNPQVTVQQPEEKLINLVEDNFEQNQPAESKEERKPEGTLSQQTASLDQSSQGKKTNLFIILLIIILSSLTAGWLLNRLIKKY